MSLEGPLPQNAPEKSIDLSSLSFGVAPQAGMKVETTANVPLPTQGSQEATAGSTKKAPEAVMGNEMIQSAAAAGGQAAPFAPTPEGQPKSSESPAPSATPAPTPSAPKPEPKAGEMTLPDTIPGTQWPFNGRYERKQARAKAEKEGSAYVDPFPGFPEM
jgi:hypothetical protein